MGDAGLTLVAIVLIGGIAVWWRNHRRAQRLSVTAHTVLCPTHDVPAHVNVRTDTGAQSCRQYLAVAGCSLFTGAAVTSPERITYLPDADFPPVTVRIEPGRAHAEAATCREDCIFVLNETAVFNARPPFECTSGVNDAIELERQTGGSPRVTRVLGYYSS